MEGEKGEERVSLGVEGGGLRRGRKEGGREGMSKFRVEIGKQSKGENIVVGELLRSGEIDSQTNLCLNRRTMIVKTTIMDFKRQESTCSSQKHTRK